MSMDGRRRRWVALDVEFTSDRLGVRLLADFGHAGLLVWVALLAAAKRSPIEGTFSYITEADGWGQLGLPPSTDFTLAEFFRLTGRFHETRKQTRGEVTTIQLRRWDELQLTPGRRSVDTQSTSDRRQTDEQTPRSDVGITTHDQTRPDQTMTRPDQTGQSGIEIAIKIAERDQANGVLIEGEPIKDYVAVGTWRYRDEPGYYDALAIEAAKQSIEVDDAVEEVVDSLSGRFSMDEADLMPEPDDEHEAAR